MWTAADGNQFRMAIIVGKDDGSQSGLDREFRSAPASRMAMTDQDAYDLLPPFPVALRTYRACRSQGDPPSVALQKTLAVWREIWRV